MTSLGCFLISVFFFFLLRYFTSIFTMSVFGHDRSGHYIKKLLDLCKLNHPNSHAPSSPSTTPINAGLLKGVPIGIEPKVADRAVNRLVKKLRKMPQQNVPFLTGNAALNELERILRTEDQASPCICYPRYAKDI